MHCFEWRSEQPPLPEAGGCERSQSAEGKSCCNCKCWRKGRIHRKQRDACEASFEAGRGQAGGCIFCRPPQSSRWTGCHEHKQKRPASRDRPDLSGCQAGRLDKTRICATRPRLGHLRSKYAESSYNQVALCEHNNRFRSLLIRIRLSENRRIIYYSSQVLAGPSSCGDGQLEGSYRSLQDQCLDSSLP